MSTGTPPERTLLVGFDAAETEQLAKRLGQDCIQSEMLPTIVVEQGRLFVETGRRGNYQPVNRVVFHGIFEHDLDFLAGLALWGGPDGLAVIRRVIARAAELLRTGGTLVVEHDSSHDLSSLFDAGWSGAVRHNDLTGRPRFTVAVRA